MKHTRLLEIIREEIAGALNEISQLNEKPNIDSPLDFTLKSPNKPITPDNINQGALQKAIDNAVEIIKKEYPEYNSNKLSNLIRKVNGQKPLKADSFSPEVLKALKLIKDTIQQQYDIFGVDSESKSKLSQFIKDYKKSPESSDSPFIAPDGKTQLEKFLSGEKKFTDDIGYNQTEIAVEKALGIKPKKSSDIISTDSSTSNKSTSLKPKEEKPESTGKKERPSGEPKTEKTKSKETDAGVDDEGNKIELDTTVKPLTGDKEIETKLKDVISKKKEKLKSALKSKDQEAYDKEKAALKQFLEKPEIAKYIKKKTVDRVNPYTISNIENEIK